MKTGILLEHIVKSFGGTAVIADVSLHIPEGTFCVFLGPSGCGKTTTLNCIAGLESVTAGKIMIQGKDVTHLPPHQRDIAMVFQSSLLYPHLSAERNIRMSLKKFNMPRAEQEKRIQHAVKILNIAPLLGKKPRQLSGGEQQRVAIAKAIVRAPKAFLLDEPLASLDAALRVSLRSEIVNLQKELETTTIFVTHDQVEAMTMGDIIVVMNAGRIEQLGTPQQIYHQPKTPFVAGFVGSPPINFFAGTIVQKASTPYFQMDGRVFKLPPTLYQRSKKKAAGRHLLGIRPQHLALATAKARAPFSLRATVVAIEQLGKECVVLVKDSKDRISRLSLDPAKAPRRGATVTIVSQLTHAHLFALVD